jgi:hypothetical protein
LSLRRVIVVTAGLVVAGIVFGALAGVAALAISLLLSGELGSFKPEVFAIAATLGALLGAVCAPIVGWLLLRHVPLGRAFGGLAIGATLGGVAGWFLPQFAHGDGILIVAALGALCAAVLLRIRHARDARAPIASDHLALLLATLVAGEACSAGWHRPPELTPGRPLDPRQQVQVWRQGSVVRWHALAIGADSISGVVYYRPSDCDSCRVSVPRATVDSIRFGDPVAAFWKSAGIVFGAMFVFCAAYCPRPGDLAFAADPGVR